LPLSPSKPNALAQLRSFPSNCKLPLNWELSTRRSPAIVRLSPLLAPESSGAARQLFDAGDKQSARKLIEFVFAREIENHQLVLQLLGARGDSPASGDTPGALELLRRLAAVVGNPYENLDPAAALLEKTATMRGRRIPRSAREVRSLGSFLPPAPREGPAGRKGCEFFYGRPAKIASNAEAPYNIRVEAATALSGAQTGAALGARS